MSTTSVPRRAAVALCLLLGAAWTVASPSPAAAQSPPPKPGVTTGGTESLTPTGVTIKGSVNPKGFQTQVFVQYGPAGRFTATTPGVTIGSAKRAVATKTGLANLKPKTKYQYRVVASSVNGRTDGATRNFTTPAIPPTTTLSAAPLVVPYGSPVQFSGTVSGTGSGGSVVQPKYEPWPFTTNLLPLGNQLVTTNTGSFAFTHTPTVTTRYAVGGKVDGKETGSPIITVGVVPRVTFTARRSGNRVRFTGTVSPAGDAVVRLRRISSTGSRKTLDKTVTRGSKPARFSFDTRRIYNTATWVVRVEPVNNGLAPVESTARRVRK